MIKLFPMPVGADPLYETYADAEYVADGIQGSPGWVPVCRLEKMLRLVCPATGVPLNVRSMYGVPLPSSAPKPATTHVRPVEANASPAEPNSDQPVGNAPPDPIVPTTAPTFAVARIMFLEDCHTVSGPAKASAAAVPTEPALRMNGMPLAISPLVRLYAGTVAKEPPPPPDPCEPVPPEPPEPAPQSSTLIALPAGVPTGGNHICGEELIFVIDWIVNATPRYMKKAPSAPMWKFGDVPVGCIVDTPAVIH